MDCPNVEEHLGALGNVIPSHSTRLGGRMRQEKWEWGCQLEFKGVFRRRERIIKRGGHISLKCRKIEKINEFSFFFFFCVVWYKRKK